MLQGYVFKSVFTATSLENMQHMHLFPGSVSARWIRLVHSSLCFSLEETYGTGISKADLKAKLDMPAAFSASLEECARFISPIVLMHLNHKLT